MWNLSAADYGWPRLSHDVAMAVIADLGFTGVDVGVFGDATHVTVEQVVRDPGEVAERLRSKVEAHGLVVADIFLTPSLDLREMAPTSRDPEQDRLGLRMLDACCQMARSLDVPGITILPGVAEGASDPKQALGWAAEGLRRRVDLAASYGLELSVEPHVGSCIESPSATHELLEAVPGLKVTLDPGHFVYQGFDPSSFLDLVPHSRHIQLRPSASGVMQTRLVEDRSGLPEIVRACRASSYTGWLASEFVWIETWECNRVDNTSEAAALREHLAQLMGRA